MRVRDVMTRDVEMTHPEATLQDAALRMRQSNVGFLPVGQGDRLVGVLTDRDIVLRAVSLGRDPTATRVKDAMTPQVLYCFEDQLVEEAADAMELRVVRRLVVLDRDKRLVGIVSLDDLATVPTVEARVGEVLERMADL